MRKYLVVLSVLLATYGVLIGPVTAYMTTRPTVIRLGYQPGAEVLRLIVGDQALLVSELSVIKVIFYFGSLVEEWKNRVMVPAEYFNMYKTVETAVKLDPYNMDAYYFAQAAFTWEIGRAEEVNYLLDIGMNSRSWDWYLPYFAGFNSAYFLKDYAAAADYMKKAADLSGNALLTRLASRYFFESGRNHFAIAYLRAIIDEEQDPKVRQVYQIRLQALQASEEVEKALGLYFSKFGERPKALASLVEMGFLEKLPQDPYGGTFYLDEKGKVRSTSQFAQVGIKHSSEVPHARH